MQKLVWLFCGVTGGPPKFSPKGFIAPAGFLIFSAKYVMFLYVLAFARGSARVYNGYCGKE